MIKSGACGTHEQCIYALFTKDRSTVAAEEKKKKKRENADAAFLSAIQTYTKQGSSGCYHLYKIYLISFIQGQFHFSLLNPYS